MDPDDVFRPYSPELKGDLEEYLKGCESVWKDSHFYGPKYFFEIKDRGMMIPGATSIRVMSHSPLPDKLYFVNLDYLLQSHGRGKENMSLIGAEKGTYDPNEILRDKSWSIQCLKLWNNQKIDA